MIGFTAWESSLHVGTAETFVKINSSWGGGGGGSRGRNERNKLGDDGVG